MSQNPTAHFAASFRGDRRGNVAMLFGLGAAAAFMFTGIAVDYGRAVVMKSRIQSVADAAVLDGVRTLKMTGDETKAFNSMKRQIITQLTENGANPSAIHVAAGTSLPPATPAGSYQVQVEANMSTGTAKAVIMTSTQTPFLSFAGITQIAVPAESAATAAVKKLDIALMVDMTGSMGTSDNTIPQGFTGPDPECNAKGDGTRLGALRVASCDLLSILYPTGDSTNVRMAIVPFSEYVYLERATMSKITGLPEQQTCQRYYVRKKWSNQCKDHNWFNKGKCRKTEKRCGTSVPSGEFRAKGSSRTEYLQTCMKERKGSQAFSDQGPSAGFQNPGYSTNPNNACAKPHEPVMALSNSKSDLASKIMNLTNPEGATAGQLGTAWAWYAIAPEFASAWGVERKEYEQDDGRNLKAVVLMTDGVYNKHHTNTCGNNRSCIERKAREDARALCTAMRSQGKDVMVFAVGLGMATQADRDGTVDYETLPESDPRKVLYDCSGGNTNAQVRYFFPYDGQALRQAFSDIGQALTAAMGKVRLSN